MEQEIEVYRQLRTSQDKYIYFLLAAGGAAIAFALNQTHGASLAWTQAPLGLAILSWGLSFFFGCRHLGYVSSSLYANGELLKVQRGAHPEVGRHPDLMAAASAGIRDAIESNNNYAHRYANFQFRLFVLGAVFYIAWHVLEMALHTAR